MEITRIDSECPICGPQKLVVVHRVQKVFGDIFSTQKISCPNCYGVGDEMLTEEKAMESFQHLAPIQKHLQKIQESIIPEIRENARESVISAQIARNFHVG